MICHCLSLGHGFSVQNKDSWEWLSLSFTAKSWLSSSSTSFLSCLQALCCQCGWYHLALWRGVEGLGRMYLLGQKGIARNAFVSWLQEDQMTLSLRNWFVSLWKKACEMKDRLTWIKGAAYKTKATLKCSFSPPFIWCCLLVANSPVEEWSQRFAWSWNMPDYLNAAPFFEGLSLSTVRASSRLIRPFIL